MYASLGRNELSCIWVCHNCFGYLQVSLIRHHSNGSRDSAKSHETLTINIAMYDFPVIRVHGCGLSNYFNPLIFANFRIIETLLNCWYLTAPPPPPVCDSTKPVDTFSDVEMTLWKQNGKKSGGLVTEGHYIINFRIATVIYGKPLFTIVAVGHNGHGQYSSMPLLNIKSPCLLD